MSFYRHIFAERIKSTCKNWVRLWANFWQVMIGTQRDIRVQTMQSHAWLIVYYIWQNNDNSWPIHCAIFWDNLWQTLLCTLCIFLDEIMTSLAWHLVRFLTQLWQILLDTLCKTFVFFSTSPAWHIAYNIDKLCQILLGTLRRIFDKNLTKDNFC